MNSCRGKLSKDSVHHLVCPGQCRSQERAGTEEEGQGHRDVEQYTVCSAPATKYERMREIEHEANLEKSVRLVLPALQIQTVFPMRNDPNIAMRMELTPCDLSVARD